MVGGRRAGARCCYLLAFWVPLCGLMPWSEMPYVVCHCTNKVVTAPAGRGGGAARTVVAYFLKLLLHDGTPLGSLARPGSRVGVASVTVWFESYFCVQRGSRRLHCTHTDEM